MVDVVNKLFYSSNFVRNGFREMKIEKRSLRTNITIQQGDGQKINSKNNAYDCYTIIDII